MTIIKPPAPLFRDPIHDGAADPTIVYNRREHSWWLLYTNRRANVDCRGVAWAHGTDIGIASSHDGGGSWIYRGVLRGLEFENGRNTFWAPEVLWHDGLYHMYVSYVPGVPHSFSGPRHILHYTSEDLWSWTFESRLGLLSDRVIDACVVQLPGGPWRMWYKDESHGSHTFAADSPDLRRWSVVGPAVTDCAHEGPNVFRWKDWYWMVTDPWNGLGVYRSPDAQQWTRQENILDGAGRRPDDGAQGQHADVLVVEDRAYVFYFTHPEKSGRKYTADELIPYRERRTSLQVAELAMEADQLVCDRDREFDFALPG